MLWALVFTTKSPLSLKARGEVPSAPALVYVTPCNLTAASNLPFRIPHSRNNNQSSQTKQKGSTLTLILLNVCQGEQLNYLQGHQKCLHKTLGCKYRLIFPFTKQVKNSCLHIKVLYQALAIKSRGFKNFNDLSFKVHAQLSKQEFFLSGIRQGGVRKQQWKWLTVIWNNHLITQEVYDFTCYLSWRVSI